MKKALYEYHFLTKERFTTSDSKKVDKSLFMWAKKKDGRYRLSFLGMINGLLVKTPYYLIADVNKYTDEINHFAFKKQKGSK